MARLDVFPIINGQDLGGTVAFYREVFGGEQVYQFPPEGEADYVSLKVGDGQVSLGRGTGPAMYGETPLPATGHAVDVCIYVEDLGATIDRARAAGVRIPVEPAAMPWGETVAYVQDPEGTMLLVIQADA
jgi:lactoylglutathione lyase